MNQLEELKNKIKRYLLVENKTREGFTEEIFESLTLIYLKLKKDFPDKIAPEKIIDSNRLNINSPIIIADLFMRRIYKNVLKIKWSNNPKGPKGEYIHAESLIELNDTLISNQDIYWDDNLFKNNQDRNDLKKALRSKVIIHEILHAGSDNLISTGFLVNDGNYLKFEKEYLKNSSLSNFKGIDFNGSSRLEELITEKLALDIVGQKIVNRTTKGNFTYPLVNPESSNMQIYMFAEIISKLFPKCEQYKFVDPCFFFAKFDEYFSSFNNILNIKNAPPHVAMNNILRNIANGKESQVFKEAIQLQSLLFSFYHEKFKRDYGNQTKIDEKTAIKIVDDIFTFNKFVLKDTMDNTNIEILKSLIGDVKNLISKNNYDIEVLKYISAYNFDKIQNLDLNSQCSQIIEEQENKHKVNNLRAQ